MSQISFFVILLYACELKSPVGDRGSGSSAPWWASCRSSASRPPLPARGRAAPGPCPPAASRGPRQAEKWKCAAGWGPKCAKCASLGKPDCHLFHFFFFFCILKRSKVRTAVRKIRKIRALFSQKDLHDVLGGRRGHVAGAQLGDRPGDRAVVAFLNKNAFFFSFREFECCVAKVLFLGEFECCVTKVLFF